MSKVNPYWAINRHLNNEGKECETDHGKRRAGVEGEVKERNMAEVLSTHAWIQNTETCWSHFKKGEGKEKEE
jgi:hypothetical protein